MLVNKTIQMDADLIQEIEKQMMKRRNFSFQAVTRDIIREGLNSLEQRTAEKEGVTRG